MVETRLISRSEDGRPAAPARIVHLGLGNFVRSHLAWYTEHAPDADQWGIAAFSGRSATNVAELQAQDGVYTLLTQGDDLTTEVISSIVAVHRGADLEAWRGYFADPQVQIVTSTITEAGYRRTPAGDLDQDDPDVADDIERLRSLPEVGTVTTAPGKFIAGLLARRQADAGPITFVPCDNVVDSGAMVATVVRQAAAAVDPTLVEWIEKNVGFVTTMVDRITPQTTAADVEAITELTHRYDRVPVVTEPFTEWVLAGDFAGDYPRWRDAGAQFVDDIVPYEHRKLWLLNGSHSLMAYAGPIYGRETVAEAITDPVLAGWVNQWWDVAGRHLPLSAPEVTAYRSALVKRFTNPAIRHRLAQISPDGSVKIPIRFLPTLNAELDAGRVSEAATRPIAAWIAHLRGVGGIPVSDPRAEQLSRMVKGTQADAVTNIASWLGITDAAVNPVLQRQLADLTDSYRA